MLGWTITFAAMTLLGAVIKITNPASLSAPVVLMFGLLFLLSLLTRLMRGRAR
jgi:hypothetical protein